jgi:hypothetical protein
MKALTPDSLTQTARSLRLRRSAVPTFRPQPRDPPDGRFEYQSPQRHQLFQASPPMSRLATRSRRNRFVILRTAGSPPVALHPASRRRSYLQFLGLRPAQARTCTVQTKRPHGTHSWPGVSRPSATRINSQTMQCYSATIRTDSTNSTSTVKPRYYSPPIRAPFSATERFISNTANTSAAMTTANTQNTSK